MPATSGPPATPPLVPQHRRLRTRLAVAVLRLALRATLVVSPRPAALLVRRVFAAGGADTARELARHDPPDVVTVRDERYGPEPAMVLDVHRPPSSPAPLPTVVWVHGGGWVGGTKDELASYLRLLASHGYATVGVRYGLAPEARYPAPVRDVMAALAHLERNADRLGLDTSRLVLAGDSAGAQIAAQAAALVTTPGYAGAVGVAPAIGAEQLRGAVLACGPYDMELLSDGADDATARRLVDAVLWAYCGSRRFREDERFATASVGRHVTESFPPALVTVGDADPLRRHSELLADRLRAAGAEPETVFFPGGHEPPLGHEYQFRLDEPAAQLFLDRLLSFLARRLGPPPRR